MKRKEKLESNVSELKYCIFPEGCSNTFGPTGQSLWIHIIEYKLRLLF